MTLCAIENSSSSLERDYKQVGGDSATGCPGCPGTADICFIRTFGAQNGSWNGLCTSAIRDGISFWQSRDAPQAETDTPRMEES